jgi:hypothetical protein
VCGADKGSHDALTVLHAVLRRVVGTDVFPRVSAAVVELDAAGWEDSVSIASSACEYLTSLGRTGAAAHGDILTRYAVTLVRLAAACAGPELFTAVFERVPSVHGSLTRALAQCPAGQSGHRSMAIAAVPRLPPNCVYTAAMTTWSSGDPEWAAELLTAALTAGHDFGQLGKNEYANWLVDSFVPWAAARAFRRGVGRRACPSRTALHALCSSRAGVSPIITRFRTGWLESGEGMGPSFG